MTGSVRQGRLVVFTLATIVFFTALGSARLWDRDEPRNARCAQEMLERGDWIVPTFDGELRTHKPILLYWMQMVSYKIFGLNEWGARFPSAFCGVITVMACYGIAARLLGHAAGLWAAVCLTTSVMFVVSSRAATPDGPLIACCTLAIYLFVRFAYPLDHSVNPERAGQTDWRLPSFWQWSAIYAACGLAVLAKGPVGFVLPTSVLGILLAWQSWPVSQRCQETRLRFSVRTVAKLTKHALSTAWSMRPLTAIAAVLLTAGPWYLAVGLATDGVWLQEFFWTHNVSRAVTTMEGHSGPPLLFYYLTLCVGTFPWSIWMMPTTLYLWRMWQQQAAWRPAIVLGLAWISVYIGAFSMAATKLPSYITPCYPGAALLYAMLLSQWAKDREIFLGWTRVGLAISAVVGMVLAGSVGFARIAGETVLTPLAPAGFMLLIASVAAARLMAMRQTALGLKFYTVGAVSMVLTLAALGPVLVDSTRKDLDLLAEFLQTNEQSRVGFVGNVEPSWIYYAGGRSDQLPTKDWEPAAVSYLNRVQGSQILLPVDQAKQFEAYLSQHHAGVSLETVVQTPETMRNTRFQAIRLRANENDRLARRTMPESGLRR